MLEKTPNLLSLRLEETYIRGNIPAFLDNAVNGLALDANRSNYEVLVVRWAGLKIKPPKS